MERNQSDIEFVKQFGRPSKLDDEALKEKGLIRIIHEDDILEQKGYFHTFLNEETQTSYCFSEESHEEGGEFFRHLSVMSKTQDPLLGREIFEIFLKGLPEEMEDIAGITHYFRKIE